MTDTNKTQKPRTKRIKTGDAAALQKLLWRTLKTLEAQLELESEREEADHQTVCRVAHAISQTSGVYLKSLETAELENRIRTLEQLGKPVTVNEWAA